MLHVENGPPGLPAGGQQFPGLGRGLGHARQLHGAAGKIIILDIDEDESGFHDGVPYGDGSPGNSQDERRLKACG